MLQFNFDNCMADVVGFENGLTVDDLKTIQPRILAAHNQLQKWRTSKDAVFLDSPFEVGLAAKFRKEGEKVRHSFENLVVLGIGGSALGLRSLAAACLPPHANLFDRKHRKNSPRLFVCDNIDPNSFNELIVSLNLRETCFIVISKSGNTTETIAQLSIMLPLLKARVGGKWKDHLYVITDPTTGPLRKFVAEEFLQSFEIPPKLGGRFSVLSAVGLFPAECLGIDTEAVLDGARTIVKSCKGADIATNLSYQHAVICEIMHSIKRKQISVMMPYSDKLALFADWYAQLLGESLGKNGQGMTPVKALGTTDQHSQIQLYMEGPNDKIITFVGVESFKNDSPISYVLETFEHLKGYSLGDILIASQKATTKALSLARRPNITVTLPEVSAEVMGELFMFYEISVAFMGALAQVNPFDQPGVELGKKLTKEMLKTRTSLFVHRTS